MHIQDLASVAHDDDLSVFSISGDEQKVRCPAVPIWIIFRPFGSTLMSALDLLICIRMMSG